MVAPPGGPHVDGSRFLRIPDSRYSSYEGGSIGLPRIGDESFGIFLHMLDRGLAFAPEPSQQVGLSRVGIAVHTPPEKWIEDGHNGQRPERWEFDEQLENAVLTRNGCLWGLTPTPEHALTRVLFRKQRQFGYQVPPTPYGAVVLIPARADLAAVPNIDEWWHKDGIYVWRDGGPKLTGMEAAQALEESFETAASKLPYRASGDDVFFPHGRGRGGPVPPVFDRPRLAEPTRPGDRSARPTSDRLRVSGPPERRVVKRQ